MTYSTRPAIFLQGIGELEQAGVLQGETLVKLLCNRAACQLQLSKPLPALADSQRAVRVSCCLAAQSTLKGQNCVPPQLHVAAISVAIPYTLCGRMYCSQSTPKVTCHTTASLPRSL